MVKSICLSVCLSVSKSDA